MLSRKTCPNISALCWEYLGCIERNRGNWDEAERLYQQCLALRTALGDRRGMGYSYNVLALVHKQLNKIPEAFAAWRAGLAACPPNRFPVEALDIGSNLGDAAFDIKDWQTAIEGYEAAITAVETSCTFAESYQEKQKRRTAQIGVYEKLVQACINSGDIGRALASVERSKSRNLIELLANRELYPKGDIPPEILTQLDTLRREVTAKQQLLETLERPTTTNSPSDTNLGQRGSSSGGLTPDAIETIRQEYQKAEQKLNKLLDIIKTYDPTFSLTQRVEPIKFSEIQGLLDEHTALIEWYCTREQIYAFVVTGEDGGISFQVSTPEAYTQLQELRQTYLDTYSQKKSDWEEQFNHYLDRLADILHISELIAPLTDKYRQLILVPYRDLHLFPLHILPLDNSSNPPYLLEEYISLGLGFLYAGATNVICSLWAVNDLSTAILMVKFYEEMQIQPSITLALKAAQQWMRTVTKQKLTEWLNPPAEDLTAPAKKKLRENLYLGFKQPNYQPYQHPIHWGAFCAIGV